ncbi:hypothetical protein [Caballeronia sp. dw_276]|uniref:hypothetical protein n=1 Tax=Caballeronia sp. dw_276 TaxID=2719795 RepID=UPI001BD5621F|nr:hypothetical protein [Caballeronia sp. dw_276]
MNVADGSPASGPQLCAEIEQLRAQFPRTQDLYREFCVLLFFRHRIALTANRLYQLVKKGSINALAEALTRFGATFSEKRRVRISILICPWNCSRRPGTGGRALDAGGRYGPGAAGDRAARDATLGRGRTGPAGSGRGRTRPGASRTQELMGSAAALDGAQIRITELDQVLAISVATASALQG